MESTAKSKKVEVANKRTFLPFAPITIYLAVKIAVKFKFNKIVRD
jgi:hypothetical protein